MGCDPPHMSRQSLREVAAYRGDRLIKLTAKADEVTGRRLQSLRCNRVS
jgi:hypothetical protein